MASEETREARKGWLGKWQWGRLRLDGMASLSCHWLGLRHLTIPAFKAVGMECHLAAGPERRGENKFC